MSLQSLVAATGQRGQFEMAAESQTSTGRRATGPWTPVGLPQPLWKQPMQANVKEAFAQRRIEVTDRIFCVSPPAGIGIGHRITIGKTHFVIEGVVDMSGLGRGFVFQCRESK